MIGQKELQEQLDGLFLSKNETQTQLNNAQKAVQQFSASIIATDGAIKATQMLIDKLKAMDKAEEVDKAPELKVLQPETAE